MTTLLNPLAPILNEATLQTYLADIELLGHRRIAQTQWQHRRSACATVTLDDGFMLFVKQPKRDIDDRQLADLKLEADSLRALVSTSAAMLAPQLIYFDPLADVVITEFLTGFRPANELRSEASIERPSPAALGAALARLHAVQHRPAHNSGAHDHLAQIAHRWQNIGPRQASLFPEGYLELVCRLQAAAIPDALDEIAQSWSPVAFIHGDIKADNVMVGGEQAGETVRLIDWELAGWGDPRWDVGAAIGDYLTAWLGSVMTTSDGSLSSWLASARIPFQSVQEAVCELIDGYKSSASIVDGDVLAWVRYAGVFLLERTIMAAIDASVLGPRSLSLVQVATQLLSNPAAMAEKLLGRV